MQFFVKLLISITIIRVCVLIGRKLPSLAGLIAVMPLTGAVVLIWLYLDNPANQELVKNYTKGAIWGIIPSILFFLVAYFCFKKHISFTLTICVSFGVWLLAAFVHQWVLR